MRLALRDFQTWLGLAFFIAALVFGFLSPVGWVRTVAFFVGILVATVLGIWRMKCHLRDLP